MIRALGRMPRVGLVCAAIAVANGACWAVITPPVWVPDEIVHYGWVAHLVETGEIPREGERSALGVTGLSAEQNAIYTEIPFNQEGKPSWSKASDVRLDRELATGRLERSHPGQAQYISNHPPLYYLLEAVPYTALRGASFFDRLFAMRLLTTLLGGLTVFFVFLFLREVAPRSQWPATVGALVLAFHPVLGFMAGGVNNDVISYAAAAALFYAFARAFRRGFDPRAGALIGAAAAVGLLTKSNIVGLLPGALLGLAVLAWRARGTARRPAVLGAAVAAAVTAVPWLAWSLIYRLSVGDAPAPTGGLAGSTVGSGAAALREMLSYIWQAALPRLPFMDPQFPYYPPWEIFFKGFVGRFGWFEYGFPSGWYVVGAVIFAALAVLAGIGLARARPAMRERWPELATYLAMAAGLAFALEVVAYRFHEVVMQVAYFEQTRYLFPLLALYGAFIMLAVKGAGRKWGPAFGALVVVLAMGHSLFSQLLTVARFYG